MREYVGFRNLVCVGWQDKRLQGGSLRSMSIYTSEYHISVLLRDSNQLRVFCVASL